MQLLEDVSNLPLTIDRRDVGPGSVSRLEFSSLAIMAFLVSIEDEFGFVWDNDVDPAIFGSFDALAGYLSDRVPAAEATT